MRKFFALSYIVLALAACNSTAKKEEVATASKSAMSFATMEVKDTILLDNYDSNSPALTIGISLQLPQDTTDAAYRIMTSIANTAFCEEDILPHAAAKNAIEALKSEYLELHDMYINEKGADSHLEWMNNYYIVEGKTEECTASTICYSIFQDQYSGGAHPYSSTNYINFDAKTGEEITLEDVFKYGYENVLTDMLTKRLAEINNVSTVEELNEIGYLLIADMFVTSNFHIKEDSIIFHYNKYDIAPYALGESNIGFSFDELKEILK